MSEDKRVEVTQSPLSAQGLCNPYVLKDTKAPFPNQTLCLGNQFAFLGAYYDNDLELGAVRIQYKLPDGSYALGWKLIKANLITHTLVPTTDTIYEEVGFDNFGGAIQVLKDGKWYHAGSSGVSTYDISTFDGLRKHFARLSPKLWGKHTNECLKSIRAALVQGATVRGTETEFERDPKMFAQRNFMNAVNLLLPSMLTHIGDMNNYLKTNVYTLCNDHIPTVNKKDNGNIAWPEAPYANDMNEAMEILANVAPGVNKRY